MRKIILTTFIILVHTVIYAQDSYLKLMSNTSYEPLNSNLIEASINVPSSPYFYTSLVERYNMGDTTLNTQDYRHLYYGYAYSEGYKPYDDIPHADSVANTIMEDKFVITATSANKLILQIEKILEKEPFSLKFLNMLAYVYSKAGDEESASIYAHKFNMLVKAIFSSGTGLDKDTPWFVLYRSDVMSIIALLGGETKRKAYVTRSCEYYKLVDKISDDKIGNIKGLYFDFSYMLLIPNTNKPKQRFEFNPYSNPRSSRYLNKNI